jgi:hypothetical protein
MVYRMHSYIYIIHLARDIRDLDPDLHKIPMQDPPIPSNPTSVHRKTKLSDQTNPLPPHRSLEHLRRKLTQEPRPIRLWKVQENLIDTFPLRITNSTQPIPSHSTRQRSRDITHDKAQRTTTDSTNDCPKPPRGPSATIAIIASFFSEPFLAQHLLKHGSELVVIALLATAEAKGGPWETTAALRDFFVDFFFGLFEGAGLVVFAAAGWVGEGVVGIVYFLELLGSGWSFGGVGWDSIRVGF